MKTSRIALLFIAVMVFATPILLAQDATQEQIVLTETVPTTFGKVWRAVKRSMADIACTNATEENITEPAEEGGMYKGKYVSEFCLLAQGTDTTKNVMKRYSEVPRIRNGMWSTFRIQYKINLKEEEGNTTKIILRVQFSGFEEYITQETHFWNSNGILEKQMMERILANVKKEIEGSSQE